MPKEDRLRPPPPDGARGPGLAGPSGSESEGRSNGDDTGFTGTTEEPVEITREEFPETWLWANAMTGYKRVTLCGKPMTIRRL